MRRIILIVLIALTLFGCKKDELNTPVRRLKSGYVGYLFYEDGIYLPDYASIFIPSDTTFARFSYEYSDQKMTRSTGGFVVNFVGGPYVFSNDAYDSLSWNENTVYVFSKYESNGVIYDNLHSPIIFYLDAEGQLVKVTKRNIVTGGSIDLYYTYSQDMIIESNNAGMPIRTFYFSENNLVKVVADHYMDGELYSRDEILFEGFDHSVNPFKGKFYFKGAFFRAFSQNNYTSYTRNTYSRSMEGTLEWTSTYRLTMIINYDSYNYPMLGEYE